MIARAGALLIVLYAAAAPASPLEDPIVAGAGVFTGPTRSHGSAIVINPAAMALASQGQHVLIMATTRLSQLFIDRDIVAADGTTIAGPEVSSTTVTPGGLAAFDFTIAKRWRFGLALHAPLAQRFAAGQEALRYNLLGGYSYQVTGSGSASFAAHSRILFGFGISLGYSLMGLEFARDTALEGGTPGVESDCDGSPCGIENPLADQRYRIRTKTDSLGELFSAKNLGLVGGTMIRVTKDWWLALSVVAPPGSISGTLDLSGDVDVDEAPRDGNGTLHGNAEIIFETPISVYLGARGPIAEKLELLGHLRWQNLSSNQRLDLRMFGGNLEDGGVPTWYPRYLGYSDVFTAAVGVESTEDQRIRFGGRLLLENGAVSNNELTPLSPSSFSIGATGGAELRLGDHLVLTGSYGLTVFPPTQADASVFDPLARIRCVDQAFDLDVCRAAREGRATPTTAGSYTRLDHSMQFSLRYDTL